MHEKDQLIELYEESGSSLVLHTLITKFGYKTLLELSNETFALNLFVNAVMLEGNYNTMYHLTVNELRKVYNFIINNFASKETEYKEKMMRFIEKYNFEFTHVSLFKNGKILVDKKISDENIRFLQELYIAEDIYFKNKDSIGYDTYSFCDDIIEAIADNSYLSLDNILFIAKRIEPLYLKIIERLYLRVANANTTTAIIYTLNAVRNSMFNSGTDLTMSNLISNPNDIIRQGLDLFMDSRFFIDNIFKIFLSISYTPTHYIAIYKELYTMFYERFTVKFMNPDSIADIVDIENDNYGQFPIQYIANNILDNTENGLLFILYYFETLKSYEIFSYMDDITNYMNEFEYAVAFMVEHELVPGSWIENTKAYKELIENNFQINMNNLNTDIVDIDALLNDIDI